MGITAGTFIYFSFSELLGIHTHFINSKGRLWGPFVFVILLGIHSFITGLGLGITSDVSVYIVLWLGIVLHKAGVAIALTQILFISNTESLTPASVSAAEYQTDIESSDILEKKSDNHHHHGVHLCLNSPEEKIAFVLGSFGFTATAFIV